MAREESWRRWRIAAHRSHAQWRCATGDSLATVAAAGAGAKQVVWLDHPPWGIGPGRVGWSGHGGCASTASRPSSQVTQVRVSALSAHVPGRGLRRGTASPPRIDHRGRGAYRGAAVPVGAHCAILPSPSSTIPADSPTTRVSLGRHGHRRGYSPDRPQFGDRSGYLCGAGHTRAQFGRGVSAGDPSTGHWPTSA